MTPDDRSVTAQGDPDDDAAEAPRGNGPAVTVKAKAKPRKAAKRKAGAKKAKAKAAAQKASPQSAKPTPADADRPAPSARKDGRPASGGDALHIPASLQHMPANLFGAGLGIAGFATAWREMSVAFGFGETPSIVLAGIACGVFVALVALYGVKTVRHFEAVKAEIRHPVQGNFFAAATMTAMILTTNLVTSLPAAATVIWAVAAIANLAVTAVIFTSWISRDVEISHVAPVWFIPIVGNLVIPIVGAPLGYTDIGWMMFAVGLLFWVILFTIVFYRLLFERQLEGPLRPSLFILIAPPSLCFIAYAVLNGGVVDGPALMFLGIALFTLLMLLPQVPTLLRLPFGLNWWSYTFPLAALSVACTLYADVADSETARVLAVAVFAVTALAVAVVTVQTIRYILAGKVFQPSEPTLPKP
ncbi:MAG: SLAC1 anion channel family protein [Alphaproteobacteria bacterium]|nr:SLAC1 anion channel family protein [Alphaproteobacteria bacterium]